jgi:hypothetical protein
MFFVRLAKALMFADVHKVFQLSWKQIFLFAQHEKALLGTIV